MSTNARPKIAPTRRATSWLKPLLYYGGIALFCILVLVGTYLLFVEAPPPKKLIIATGGLEGAYYDFGKKYAEILEKNGLSVEVKATKGTVENLQLLQDDSSGVSIAIVQGGVADPSDPGPKQKLTALGSLYREPLWIFYRGDKPIASLGQLAGQRVAIGPPGSGTRPFALLLLKDNGITEKEATLLPSTGKQAAEDLRQGQVDAVFLVASIKTPYVKELFLAKGIHLVSLAQQAAYDQRYHFLSPVTLPPGLVDLGRNIPDKETRLVAPTAMLVARKDLHPALVPLLLAAAAQIHGGGDLISRPQEFPSALYTDLPLDEDARHYYKSGPPLLQRFLPFWLATMVDRLKVLLIPLIMLLMPVFRLAPPLVHWRNRRKIYLWYNVMRDIEEKISRGISHTEVREELARLQKIEDQLPKLDVPLGYMGEFYNMRFHLRLVRDKLDKLLAEGSSAKAAAASL